MSTKRFIFTLTFTTYYHKLFLKLLIFIPVVYFPCWLCSAYVLMDRVTLRKTFQYRWLSWDIVEVMLLRMWEEVVWEWCEAFPNDEIGVRHVSSGLQPSPHNTLLSCYSTPSTASPVYNKCLWIGHFVPLSLKTKINWRCVYRSCKYTHTHIIFIYCIYQSVTMCLLLRSHAPST